MLSGSVPNMFWNGLISFYFLRQRGKYSSSYLPTAERSHVAHVVCCQKEMKNIKFVERRPSIS